jgi:hypothetical protein
MKTLSRRSFLATALAGSAAPLPGQRKRKSEIGDKNVLFLVVDDLRPTLRC